MSTPSIDRYVEQTVDRIEDFVQLKESDRVRLRDDLRTTILQRLGDEPTTEQIVSEIGSSADWAREFAENAELPKTVFSANYINRRTEAELFGLPLVHVACGTRNGKKMVARGFLAVGDIAVGYIAIGGVATGWFAFGGVALGLIAFGGVSLALLLAIGGCAVGGIACGGCAAGVFAHGGLALGYYAFGGLAVGHTAVGGLACGVEGAGGAAHVRTRLAADHWMQHLVSLQKSFLFQFLIQLVFIVPFVAGMITMCLALRWGQKTNRDREESALRS